MEAAFVSGVFSSLCTMAELFYFQDLISDSPYFLPNNCYDVLDNLVLDQLVISLWIFFFILTTFLLVIVLVL